MRQLWILVALGACSKFGGDSSGSGGAAGGGGPAPPADWSAKKLVSQTGTVDKLSFTIDIPEGLPRDPRSTGDWQNEEPKWSAAPQVYTQTIEIARIQDLKAAKYNATLNAFQKEWVRTDSRPDSWALTYAEPDKSRIEAITYKQANDTHFIKCKAVQATGGGALPSYKATMKMLETVCDSLKAVEGAPSADTPEPVEPGAGQPGLAPAGEPAPTPTEKADEPTPTEKAPEGDKPAEDKPAEKAEAPADDVGGRLRKAAAGGGE